ncbi:MAG: NifB/NifX family molybdenum-iron cluster-binding protein [Candidatus Lokiarchaeota archaeon]|nr:NifB/NifX family molybdenum-iron cluster-binding protein [Candidatus Lokiarchaeota archaeon]
MIYAISTDAGQVCPHFGRAPEFTIITIEDNKLIDKKIYQNPGHQVGSIPKFINEIGAKCMITGGMGHRAIQFFHDYGIEVIMGASGSIEEIIQKIIAGTLEGGESICTPGGGKGYGVDKIHTEADEGHHHVH